MKKLISLFFIFALATPILSARYIPKPPSPKPLKNLPLTKTLNKLENEFKEFMNPKSFSYYGKYTKGLAEAFHSQGKNLNDLTSEEFLNGPLSYFIDHLHKKFGQKVSPDLSPPHCSPEPTNKKVLIASTSAIGSIAVISAKELLKRQAKKTIFTRVMLFLGKKVTTRAILTTVISKSVLPITSVFTVYSVYSSLNPDTKLPPSKLDWIKKANRRIHTELLSLKQKYERRIKTYYNN